QAPTRPRTDGFSAWSERRFVGEFKLRNATAVQDADPTAAAIWVRLFMMMFLEFFVWGAWFVTMGSHLTGALHFTDPQSALAYATQSWGAIIAPFLIGLIADKYVNAERLLGVIHLVRATLMYVLANATQCDGCYPYLLLYMILY